MEYCYSGIGNVWYESWNRHVCRKGKCAADRPFRSTGVTQSRKQRFCSPSCLLTQIILKRLTIRHWCICIWNWTEMLSFFFPVESKDCMNSASFEYRNMSTRRGAQFVPIGMQNIFWKTFPPKITKMLSTRNSSMLMIISSVYSFTK